MKWVVRIALIVLVLGALGVLALFLLVTPLLKKGVESGGTYAMGVDTKLEGIDLGLFSAQLDMSGLHVANPEGFRAEHFFELGSGEVAVTLPSLLAETVEVPLIELRNIALNLEEENGKKNYSVILDNLKKFGDSSEPGQTEPGEEDPKDEEDSDKPPGKGFVINQLTIQDVTVNADWAGQTVRVNIPEIPLSDIGSDTEGGVVLSQLSGIIIEAILKAMVENAGNLIPAGLVNELNQGLASIGKLGDYTAGAVTEVTAAAAEALEGAATELKEATADLQETAAEATTKLNKAAAQGGEELNKAAKQIAEGLNSLLKGKKGDP